MALCSHLVAAARFGPYGTDERVYATELMPLVPEHSLLILDRNFPAPALLLPYQAEGGQRHWLVRLPKNQRWQVLEEFGAGDALAPRPAPCRVYASFGMSRPWKRHPRMSKYTRPQLPTAARVPRGASRVHQQPVFRRMGR